MSHLEQFEFENDMLTQMHRASGFPTGRLRQIREPDGSVRMIGFFSPS